MHKVFAWRKQNFLQEKHFSKICEKSVDETQIIGYNSFNLKKQAVKRRVSVRMPFREPRLV